MTLRQAVEVTKARAFGPLEERVTAIAYDSRRVAPGSLFVAIRGFQQDGNAFIPEALARGAVAIVSENSCPPDFPRAWLQVEDARRALAELAAAFYDHPSRTLTLIGVTGTNGKTTTTYLIDAVIRATGERSARLGTTTYKIGDEEIPAERTTPEAPEIQRFLRRAVEAGCRYAVLEVSSHALELKRVHGCEFTAAVFTNLTPEHLDFHGTMEAYFAAKRKLFDGTLGKAPEIAILNGEDPYARELVAVSRGRVLTYGETSGDVFARSVTFSLEGTQLMVRTPQGDVSLRSRLLGRPNVRNILAAVATGLALGFSLEEIAKGIELCPRVPGRFEVVSEPTHPLLVLVDYAHTEDALRNLLQTAHDLRRALSIEGRLLTVFGCGGDRDRRKRAPMGEVAGALSHLVIVTSDNPRSEDPEAILAEIETGLARTNTPYLKIVDRAEAIRMAIALAEPGDIVLIAGKGHETYQVLKDRIIPFDDREVARAALKERFGSKESETQ
ncbi:MAG: UDP-N-acetylmuramoyl-L-alanyl-D-glutamate--2,6-diaminopimelate ligase [Blastocatellia bacterium]|nr:UDP-N-acetylmuramoyl-L-alanyl-D-glutamate--2,6-diaminopimelate ligase [Blastocatellia bacterium]MCS7157030.1 UDP-N-acetylmuramoyl-L-alanyl-D-glutamate--2,6-diaminopimelate ligase [Blastocatellia bacterium]